MRSTFADVKTGKQTIKVAGFSLHELVDHYLSNVVRMMRPLKAQWKASLVERITGSGNSIRLSL